MSRPILVILLLSIGLQLRAQNADVDSATHWTRIANRVIGNNPDSAAQLLGAAADIYLKAGKNEALCRVYNGLAASHIRRYDYQAAEHFAKLGIAHSKTTLSITHPAHINLLNNLGAIYRQKGALVQAKKCYDEALEISLSAKTLDLVSLSRLYNNIGVIYRRMGDPQEALDYFQAAYRHLAASEKASNRQLFSLGFSSSRAYDDQGQLEQARQTMYESRPLLGKKSDKKSARNWIRYAHRLANLHLEQSVFDSVSYYLDQADELRQKYGPYREQVSLEIRASLARKNDDWDTAEQYLWQSMELRSKEFAGLIKSPALAQSYQQLGDLYRESEEWDKANQAYLQALFLLSEADSERLPRLDEVLQLRESITVLQAYIHCQSKLYAQNQQLDYWEEAISASLLADSCISLLRHSHQEDQAKFRLGELGHDIYEHGIALAFARHQYDPNPQWIELALRFSEGSKAMVLFESQQQLNALHNAGLPDSLTEKETYLKGEIAFYKNLLLTQSKADSSSKNRWQQLLFESQQEAQAFRKRLEKNYPLYYQMCYAEVPVYSLLDLQSRIEPQKMILSYFWGESAVYAWAISAHEVHFFQIDEPNKLAQEVAQLRTSLQKPDYSRPYFRAYTKLAHKMWLSLSDGIDLQAYQSLAIIPDGPLSNIPWEALLYEPLADDIGDKGFSRLYRTLPYAFSKWGISYGFSLRLQLEKLAERKSQDFFAAFAPSYTDSLALVYNQASAQKLQKQFNGVLFQGTNATESAFKAKGEQFAVLHLAMHGRVDPVDGQKTHLQFSPEDNLQDGYLHLFELYDLSLSAQMVVLAACESAAGNWVEGEGVMSLSRAFRYAGCPSLVASLWEADGRVAAQLLEAFYRELDQGNDKVISLQSARKSFLQTCSPDLTHPSYWCTFVITGDDSPLQRPSYTWLWATIIISLLSATFALISRKNKKQGD
ncbi:MAG: CHAT domain-containing protein [Bacteroidia bacterium]